MNIWLLIILVAVLTAAIKAAGPVALGGRELPAWFSSIVTVMPAAVLTALVVTAALANGKELSVGPDTAGVAVAGLIAWRGGSVIMCVLAAAIVTAGLRAI
ncbi:AzlD domain-containing protein [Aeromicrobium sp.]|jgi:branched-subunit amino acid transport protein|uniref:AzlD domain-containing protein n=1 Tax=Aeromicrobium sp. TaxID=1871063 RepID=UPI003C35DF7D